MLSSFTDMHGVTSPQMSTFPAKVKQGDTLISHFSSQTINKCLSFLFSTMFFTLFVVFC